MKAYFILFAVIAALSTKANACSEKYEFQVGPFFSTSTIFRYWNDFAIELSKKTGCKINTIATSNFEQYLNAILDKRNHIYLAPSHYTKAFNQLGYQTILRSSKAAQVLLVSRHDLTTDNLSLLEGDEILVPSIYTRAYLELEAWLKKHQLFEKVTFDLNHTHDSAALIMLKGKKSTTVMLSAIYKVLPDAIKSSYSAIPISPKSGAYLHVTPDVPQKIVEQIKLSADHLKFHKWTIATPPFEEAFQDEFLQQLESFKAKTVN